MMITKFLGARGAAVVAVIGVVGITGLFARRRGEPAVAASEASALVSRQSIVIVSQTDIQTGPWVSGTLKAEREATISAELAGTVAATYVDEGTRVSPGTVLGRIEDPTVETALIAARSAVHTAEENEASARRNEERASALLNIGGVPKREAEAARTAHLSAEAALADAKAGLAVAQRRVDKTVLRAPFSGVVSRRGAKTGDVVLPGTLLFTVVDPKSMRLEAAVPAARLQGLRLGEEVRFTVIGYGNRAFVGSIEHINPVADPATRQVSIYVRIPNERGELVAGLFAEGRVTTESRPGVMVPLIAVAYDAPTPSVLRLRGGRTERVAAKLGVKDDQSESIEVISGVAAGDTLITGGARALAPGTRVRLTE
ncbi:MAG TPA: efflux RND transporter periplasmic adaptor subunit [Longimicrobiales bacterium]